MPALAEAPPDLGEFAALPDVASNDQAARPDLGEFADLPDATASPAPLTEAAAVTSGDDPKPDDSLGEFASLPDLHPAPAPKVEEAAKAAPDTSILHQSFNALREFGAGAGQYIMQGIAGAMHAGAKALADEGVANEPNPLLSKYGFTQDMAREQAVQTMERAKVVQEKAGNIASESFVDPALTETVPARLARAAGGTLVAGAEALIPGVGVPLMAGHAGYAAYSAGLDMGQTEEQATRAGVATAVGMSLFGAVNLGAAAGVAKILSKLAPDAGKLTTFISQFAGQEAANEMSLRALRATTDGMNAPEGEKLKKAIAAAGGFNLEDQTFNALFAGIGAAHAAGGSRESVPSHEQAKPASPQETTSTPVAGPDLPREASASVEPPRTPAEVPLPSEQPNESAAAGQGETGNAPAITVFRGEMQPLTSGKHLSGIQDIGALVGINEEVPLAPFDYYTTDVTDAEHYARADQRAVSSYQKRTGDGAKTFEVLHGHSPRDAGETRSIEISPKRTFDLTAMGTTADQFKMVEKVNDMLGHDPLPENWKWKDVPEDVNQTMERSGLYTIGGGEYDEPTWAYLRNRVSPIDIALARKRGEPLAAERTVGSNLADLLKAHGYDAVAYMHETPDGPVKHYALLREPAPATQDIPDFTALDKLKRVAAEAGPTESTGMGFQASGNPVLETVVRPWIEAVKGLASAAKSAFQFTRIGPQRDMVAAKFDAADNQAGYVARQARRSVELAGRSETAGPKGDAIRQQAATFVRQSGGDKEGMLRAMDAARGKGYDTIFDYAKAHWDELQPIADKAVAQTDAAYHEAQAAGVEFDYRQNYVKGAYDDPFAGKVIFDETGGGRGTGTSFKKAKVFDNYAEAIAAGFKPKELRLDLLTESAVNSTLRSVNRAKWAQSLGEIKMPDGEPVIAAPKPNGTAPNGYKMVQVTPGKLVPVHEEMEPTIRKLVDISHVPKLVSQSFAAVKHNILVFDLYHGFRFGKMQMAFERQATPSYHKGLSILEYADRDLDAAVQHKLISPAEAQFARENRPKLESLIASGLNAGRISDALYKDVVPLMPGARVTNKFIFEKLSRGIISQSSLMALERNARLHPEWTPEQLNRYTAREVNTYYRNLGNQGIFKSKTFQDTARAVLFAPQWIEGMVRSEARGYGQGAKFLGTGKLGNIGAGMGTGLVAYLALTQAINLITRGKPTWENDEPGHKLDAWIPDFVQGSGGFFMSPLSIFAETTHDALKYTERGMRPEDVFSQLLSNKLHPNIRALWTLLHGTDFYGRPLQGMDRELVAAESMAPIPLFARTGGYKGGIERQLASTLGEKITPAPSSTNNIYALAHAFKEQRNLLTNDEKSGVRHEGEYTDLTHALQNGDMGRAQSEYEKLLERKKAADVANYYGKYATRAFTGNQMTENSFRRSLDRGQLDIYNNALRERQQIAQQFRLLRQPAARR